MMGLTGLLPQHVVNLMSEDDRKAYAATVGVPVIGMTTPELDAKAEEQAERELQRQICQWLNLEGLFYEWSPMHKKKTGTVGSPDYQFAYRGRFVALEAKTQTGQLDPEQVKARDKIIAQGGVYRVIRSLAEAQLCLREVDAVELMAQSEA